MRRLGLVTVAMTALALTVPAAHDVAGQTTLGFRGGVNFASLSGDGGDAFDSRTGLGIGATLAIPVSPTLGIQLGLGYQQKGASASEDGAELTLALDYVEIPALLRFTIPAAGSISPRLYLGPTLSFEASCSVSAEASGISASIACDQSEGELGVDVATKSIDFGAMGGAGLAFGTAGPLSITLDVFYTLGLTSIDDSDSPDDVKNRTWMIHGGVELPFG